MPNLLTALIRITEQAPLHNMSSCAVNPSTRMHKNIVKVIRKCWFVNNNCQRLISCIIWLRTFASDYPTTGAELYSSLEQRLKVEWYNMLQVRRNDVVYPSYYLNGKSQIYRSLSELDNQSQWRLDLPCWLRRFTQPCCALNILLLGIDLAERQKAYSRAVGLIESLLKLNSITKLSADLQGSADFCCAFDQLGRCKIGHLLARLLTDLGVHLKQPGRACTLVLAATDSRLSCLTAGSRLAVNEQLGKLLAVDKHLQKRARVNEEVEPNTPTTTFLNLVDPLIQAPEVHLEACINATSQELGTSRPFYLWQEGDLSVASSNPSNNSEQQSETLTEASFTLLLSVEQWVIRYYQANFGYTFALHCESSVYLLLYLLLFADIIYDHVLVQDTFLCHRQSCPADLRSPYFYRNRQSLLDTRFDRLAALESSEAEDVKYIKDHLTTSWDNFYGTRCIWSNWELFESVDQVIDLFWCLGPKLVASICRLFATDYRSWHSGMPDLIFWSPPSGQLQTKCKLVEVKGPTDHLSHQQLMWLDRLKQFGADVEVCHVSATRLKSLNNKDKDDKIKRMRLHQYQ